MRLKIITPVSRPQLLPKIELSLACLVGHFDFEWLRITDDKGPDIGGGRKRNAGLEQIKDDDCWVYHLDDDTVLHPLFGQSAKETIVANPLAKVIIFSTQLYPDNGVRLDIEKLDSVGIGNIDTGQVLIHSDMRDIRWLENDYHSDGHYIIEVVQRAAEVSFCRVPCVVYNALEAWRR